MARHSLLFPRWALLGSLLLGSVACRAVPTAFGTDLPSGKAAADGIASAFEQRVTRPLRTTKYVTARHRMERAIFAPSSLMPDTSLWTSLRSSRMGSVREMGVVGAMINGQYILSTQVQPPAPTRIGDSRHLVTLTQLGTSDDYQWVTTVDNAIGAFAPARATDVARALFASLERPASLVRAEYRTAFPRASAALARGLVLDSLITTRQPDGSTLTVVQAVIADDRLASTFPALGRFSRKYIAPASYQFRLTDAAGGEWFEARAARSRLTFRFRSRDGELQPLTGAARHCPDTLSLVTDAAVRVSMFTVGFTSLVGDFVHVSTPTERSWSVRWTREPSWNLPLLAEQLLHAPLARPFAGAGTQFRIGFVRQPAGHTLMTRTWSVVVRESAIMRWLGKLGNSAMRDYSGPVEDEVNRYIGDLFAAFRADLAALPR